ncbi:MAG: hypothetical protein ACFFEN_15345 [Candidatus Thorarchaeota archaeon]
MNLKEIPICFGNFCKSSSICNKCQIKLQCQKIPSPKEPDWCNPE